MNRDLTQEMKNKIEQEISRAKSYTPCEIHKELILALKSIKTAGLFYSLDRLTIYEVYENQTGDKDEHPLLVTTYSFDSKTESGIRIYEDLSGCDVDIRYCEDLYVTEVHDKYRFESGIGGAGYLVEDKLTYKEKLEKIKDICNQKMSECDIIASIKQIIDK